jgi:hypothetical protein
MKTMIPPEKFPEPWLFDTAALLAELDRVRGLVLAIPLHNDTYGPTNTAALALWELRDRLQFLVRLQAERQREWAKKQIKPTTERSHRATQRHGRAKIA